MHDWLMFRTNLLELLVLLLLLLLGSVWWWGPLCATGASCPCTAIWRGWLWLSLSLLSHRATHCSHCHIWSLQHNTHLSGMGLYQLCSETRFKTVCFLEEVAYIAMLSVPRPEMGKHYNQRNRSQPASVLSCQRQLNAVLLKCFQ
jgi:hypothetical protein